MATPAVPVPPPPQPTPGEPAIVRLRRIFRLEDTGQPQQFDDTLNDVYYMDPGEQDDEIIRLLRDDIVRNEWYARALAMLTLAPLPWFLLRWYHSARATYFDVFAIVSLVVSFLSVPEVEMDAFALLPIQQWRFRLLRLNWYVSSLLVVWVLFDNYVNHGVLLAWGWEPKMWELRERMQLAVMPWLMLVTVVVGRRLMEIVNLEELYQLRYNYQTV